MHAHHRRLCRRILAAALPAAALLTAALSLAACGSATTGSSPSPSASPTTTLGQALSHLDRLVVSRSVALRQNHLGFGFPATVTVSDPAEVRAVAQALLALPAMPTTALNAPIDLGIVYRLVFSGPGGRLPAISVAVTGTQAVRGLGVTRWVARSPGFWHTLGSAMGLAHPEYATFRGTLPTS